MTSLSSSLVGLPLEQLTLYHAVDPYLSSIFIFHGPVTTANSTLSSSRIQAHIITPSGVHSYPRITISPAAPLYAAVNHLPREKQGDEIYRGLAVCLFKYFCELSELVRDALTALARSGKQGARLPRLFDEVHAADLANRMAKVDNVLQVVPDLKDAFVDRIVPCIDVDLVLPPGTIDTTSPRSRDSGFDADSCQKSAERFGKYAPLIEALGDPIFLPTSKLKRAPSQSMNASKSRVFAAAQKETLRLSMCEVVDTEERYVGKMYDLVHNVAHEFRQKARDKSVSSTSPDEKELMKLFPTCLNEILEVNLGFLSDIRQVLEDTEKDALGDITKDTVLDSTAMARDSNGKRKDPMGIIAFARCLQDWFPRFSQPYGEYMNAHTGFAKVLNSFLHDQTSSFSRRVYDSGEQRMRSLLMEPVQRLPRYSLLIDTMTSALPVVHPAVKSLLNARDIITEICSLDSTNSSGQSLRKLQNFVTGWSASVSPSGRLITAADFCILSPPYRPGFQGSRGEAGIMLVYTDFLILVSKSPESKLTARGLYAELDKPQPAFGADPASSTPELKFLQASRLIDVRCSQSNCGNIMYLVPAENFLRTERSRSKPILQALELTSSYEGKAHKLIEEITKARIEGRFPEQYRECGKWSLHHPGGTCGNLGIFLSVFEESLGENAPSKPSSTIKLSFDSPKTDLSKDAANTDIEVNISMSIAAGGRFKMELDSVLGISFTDLFTPQDFVPVLSKRLHTLLRPLNQPQNPFLTDAILSANFHILRTIAERILASAKVSKALRPRSPTKLLSTFLGGQAKEFQLPLREPSSPQKDLSSTPSASKPSKVTNGGISIAKETSSELELLEKTFFAYIIAIRSRSGNIVGRTLRARDRADQAAVNELYNVLLNDAGKIQAAAEAPVDVLIVAFETFMAKAWKEKIGPLIPAQSLMLIQSKFDSLFPGDFEDFFRKFLAEMSPQTRRALAGLVKLLAELLDASGNDGDRGALTEVFSEILTEKGDPREYISLLDRLVEDFERLFDENAPSITPMEGTLINDPNRRDRSQSVNHGSVNSNNSSFRKRFGFGLHRERSKTESESKVSSIIRTLSKSKGPGSGLLGIESPASTLPKVSLMRTKSTDLDIRLQSLLRPGSRDRPFVPTFFSSDNDIHRPGSARSDAPTLSSIGEDRVAKPVSPRKKRRSSISDLRPVSAGEVTPLFQSPKATRNIASPATPKNNSTKPEPLSTPSVPSSQTNGRMRLRSPIRLDSPTRITSPPVRQAPLSRKENTPPSPRATPSDKTANRKTNLPTSPKKRTETRPQSYHTSVAGLKERTLPPNGSEGSRIPLSTVSTPKVQKPKMQNPQKLRERVQNEKKAVASAESGLQAEVTSIGHEISNSRASPTKGRPTSSSGTLKSIASPTSSSPSATLAARVRGLSDKVAAVTSDLNSKITSLEKDIENSLIVSERRAKKLDELYREASAENEALYQRFNDELSRIAKDVRHGAGEKALGEQLKGTLDELTRVKKENLRLKREIGGLKAQQANAD
ncbi:hypothetical protein PRK78_006454 [Emydomyces testavorans]|uniref:DH domain-containing protein n=1 Tax=Emydomyces testavorans TaxID=2070801 RepID=A0AAF0DP67_9EURO|nr:hypothetical protein PRK78_006454 [Emydomyces testavorans]